jgi:hypothetical protein
MARAATTSDAFNAVAEPRRRDILNYLAMQERSVNEIVDAMEMGPLHEWTSTFERLWKHQLLRIKERAETDDTQKQ